MNTELHELILQDEEQNNESVEKTDINEYVNFKSLNYGMSKEKIEKLIKNPYREKPTPPLIRDELGNPVKENICSLHCNGKCSHECRPRRIFGLLKAKCLAHKKDLGYECLFSGIDGPVIVNNSRIGNKKPATTIEQAIEDLKGNFPKGETVNWGYRYTRSSGPK
jgi:hypothetical protein